MNLHSTEFEGNNSTVRSGNAGRDELENSSCRIRGATDLYRLLKYVVKQIYEKERNHIRLEQRQQRPKTERKGERIASFFFFVKGRRSRNVGGVKKQRELSAVYVSE